MAFRIHKGPIQIGMKVFVLWGALNCCLWAQTFEVASVKLTNRSGAPQISCSGGPGTNDPLHFRCSNAGFAYLAHVAYAVPFQDMEVPDGVSLSLPGCEIEAVVPAGATQADLRVMLQNLLTERFHMKWHRESRNMDGYVLTAPKPKLRQSSSDTKPEFLFGSNVNPNRLIRFKARGETMDAFVEQLLLALQTRVVNETNLEGGFDFDVEFVSPVTTTPIDGPSVFAALDDLGLSLKSGKRPASVFIIDSADRIPTPN